MDEASVIAIVTEYFSDSSSQSRKRELEQNLESIRSHPQALSICHNLLVKDGLSPYVEWFCMSTFEKSVKQWPKLNPQDRASYRHFLWNLLTHRHPVYKPFVLNTLIKTLVLIGTVDYPTHWPALFHDIHDFRSVSLKLTLSLIQVIIEEFSSTRADLSSTRKQELRHTLIQQSPSLISFITEILTSIYDSCISDPSIPFTSPIEKVGNGASIALGLHSPLKSNPSWQLPIVGESPSHNILGTSPRVGAFAFSGSFDAEAISICSLCLTILLQLFSTIPLSETAVPAVDVVLRYCRLCDAQTVDLGTLAMSVVNEILARNFVPNEAVAFVLSIARQTCVLLRRLTDEEVKGTGKLELDENYQSKFTDFLNCFVSHHIQRGENIPDFPMGELLQLFYRFTFIQASPEGFQQCLHVWDTFMEYLIAQKSISQVEGEILANKYQSGLVIVAKETLSKILITENPKELSEIEFERDETEGLSEWEKFTQPCIDLIVKITDVYPSDLLLFYFNLLVNFGDRFLTMNSGTSKKVERRSVVQDLSTIVRLFGQLSVQFTNNFTVTIPAAHTLLFKFTEILNFCIGNLPQGGLSDSILCLYLFGTLKLYIHWIELYFNHGQTSPEDLKQCKDLLNRLIELSVIPLSYPATSIYSSRLLLSLAKTETMSNLYMAITNACLISEQEWKSRQHTFNTVSVIERNVSASSDPTTKRNIKKLLMIFSAIMNSVSGGVATSKDIMAGALQDVLNLYPPLLNVYQYDSEMFETLLDFSLSALRAMKRQIARDFFAVAGVLDKVVMFLMSVVEESSKRFEGLLKDVVSFVVSDVFTRVLQNAKSETAKSLFYDLLVKAILFHQQYFFGSTVKSFVGRGSETGHDEELLSLLKALGAAFLDPNIEVFRQALTNFDGLNNKCLLFTKTIVQENFLVLLGDMLFGILIQRSHDLLKEDIVGCLVDIFLCGNEQVKVEMIPYFVKNHCGGLSGEQQEVLVRYMAEIKAIVADFTYFTSGA
ncbi:armadillo-type protein [Chytridium lagenaria]|nr:armadillo-type protein [Chytridium lagenaria]